MSRSMRMQQLYSRSVLSKTLIPLRPSIRPLSSTGDTAAALSKSSTASSTRRNPNFTEFVIVPEDGCDFKQWLVVVDKRDENMTRDAIIYSYSKTLAKVIGSEKETRIKIYSGSTKPYAGFGALFLGGIFNKILGY